MTTRLIVVYGLAVFSAVTFLLGVALHAGARIPLGFTTLDEPTIVPAAIVEGLCGLAFVASLYAKAARQPWARSALIGANVFGLAGVALGLAVQAGGRNQRTALNHDYHLVMVVVQLAALALLLLPRRDTPRDRPHTAGTHVPMKG
jgi:hypothetical protein